MLLTLNAILAVISTVIATIALVLAVDVIGGVMRGADGEDMLMSVMGPAMGILGLCLPVVGVSIAYAIIRYMALYDVYKSMDPDNCVLFLVLSIFINITEPFFLFFNRNKDVGMPPRRQPAYDVPETVCTQPETGWEPVREEPAEQEPGEEV